MAKRKVLVQWIGHSDLRALATLLPSTKQKQILDGLGGAIAGKDDCGPTKSLLRQRDFDEVRLLSNYPAEWNNWFAKWLGSPVVFVEVELSKPTDYSAIFEIADSELQEIKNRKDWGETELCLHLSPGTPAMAAVWLLLGKTRYPATFYETSRGGDCWITNVPFDLVDVIPEILHSPDAHLQHLTDRAPSEVEGFSDIIGDSRGIRDAVGRAQRSAIRNVSVLLLGESGTGKELFARAIHQASRRRDKPFKALNCAALPKDLLESELFGYKKGAFTGANSDKPGLFELANDGTLFLDEFGECSLETQVKLLRVLQPLPGERPTIRRFTPIGAKEEKSVDVRVIAATNVDPFRAMKQGELREDLYYRVAHVVVRLPALRERKSDLPKIAEHLLGLLNRQFEIDEPGYQHKSLSAPAMAFVKQHEWPGNVRQLHNALVQAAVLTDGKTIGRRELISALGEMPGGGGLSPSAESWPLGDGFQLEDHLNSIHKAFLRRAMEEAHGVKAQAARLLGIKNYQTLDAQLKRLNVEGNWEARSS